MLVDSGDVDIVGANKGRTMLLVVEFAEVLRGGRGRSLLGRAQISACVLPKELT